ncbi:MAG TPA: DDE-type integrase/transposase/recombinase, partial [Sphaerochaeta sp.]|nr:DDE-type integrase/transposase/recombinase [Sphaerochaeta sp.]
RISMSAIYRVFKDYDKEKKARKSKDMRRFQMENCNDVWMLDAMVGPKVTVVEDGKEKTITAMLWAFIDDKSRLITHGEFYRDQKAESLLCCLWEAMSKRGLPRKIFTDNGSAMKDNRLRLGCADLEISLSYAKIYTPTSKAKIERFFSTVRMQFLPLVEGIILSLRELNAHWVLWLKEYNSRYHSGIGSSPLDCYMDNIKAVRPAPSDMSRYFRARLERKVSAARTIRFNNKYYQVPLGYANLTIEIRFFTPEGQIEAFYNGKSIGFIEEVDFIANGNAHRQSREDK